MTTLDRGLKRRKVDSVLRLELLLRLALVTAAVAAGLTAAET